MPDRANTFPKHERLRSKFDFERLFARRCSVADEHLTLFGLPNALPYSRAGFAVPRRFGSAVVRNRFKRRMREAYRLTKADLPTGLDLILMPRSAAEPPLEDLRASLRRLITQLAEKLERQERKA